MAQTGLFTFPTQASGNCQEIMSLQECQAFAANNIEVARFNSYKSRWAPRGCYIWTGANRYKNEVYYNPSGTAQCTDKRECICAPNVGATSVHYKFTTTTSGQCSGTGMMSEEECRNFASQNQAVTRFNSYKSPHAPPGCYIWTGAGYYKNEVYYNAHGTKSCTNWRQCICKADSCSHTCRVRQNWNEMKVADRINYIETLNIARRDEPYKSQYDNLVSLHSELDFNVIHGQNQFLAWHRWFIFAYENILRQITPCITVPYWAWEVAGSNWIQDEIWGPGEHQFGTCGRGDVNDGPFSDFRLPTTNGRLRRNCNGALPRLADMRTVLALSSSNFGTFFWNLNRPHGNVHMRVGGSMGDTEVSGETPEFFLHHNNVDRIWTNWQLKSESHEFSQSPRTSTLSGSNGYTVEDFTRARNQAGGTCVEYADHIEVVPGRRRLSTKSAKVKLVVDMTNELPTGVAFENLLVHTNELSLQTSEDFEAGELMFAAKQHGESLSDERAHEIAHEHQENSVWGKYIKQRIVDTEYLPATKAKAFFADIVGITAESVRNALEVTQNLKGLRKFDDAWNDLEELFIEQTD